MSLPDVLLGLLQQPMSGSDLSSLFRSSLGHFWHADISQIYRALDRLEADGCVRSRSVPSARGPAKNLYRLTRRGARRLHDWLAREPRIPAAKFEYLAQFFVVMAGEKPRRRAMEILRSMRGEAARQAATLEALDERFREVPGYPAGMPATYFYPWLTLRHGLLRRRAFLAWIDEALGHLQARPAAADGDAGPGAMPELLRHLREMNGMESPHAPGPAEEQEGEA